MKNRLNILLIILCGILVCLSIVFYRQYKLDDEARRQFEADRMAAIHIAANIQQYGHEADPEYTAAFLPENALPQGVEVLSASFRKDPYTTAKLLWEKFPQDHRNLGGYRYYSYKKTQYEEVEVCIFRTPNGYEIQCRPRNPYLQHPRAQTQNVVEFVMSEKDKGITRGGSQNVTTDKTEPLTVVLEKVYGRLDDLQLAMLYDAKAKKEKGP